MPVGDPGVCFFSLLFLSLSWPRPGPTEFLSGGASSMPDTDRRTSRVAGSAARLTHGPVNFLFYGERTAVARSLARSVALISRCGRSLPCSLRRFDQSVQRWGSVGSVGGLGRSFDWRCF